MLTATPLPPTHTTIPKQIVDDTLRGDGIWQRVFSDIRQGGDPDHDTLLRFRALSTDGGVDANRASYWVDHMFAHNTHTAFCSEIGNNIHCLAVLLVCATVWCVHGGVFAGVFWCVLVPFCHAPTHAHSLHNKLLCTA